MTHEEVVKFIKEGCVLGCPENTPSAVYQLMKMCWQRKPNNRPPFKTIHKTLCTVYEDVYRLHGRFDHHQVHL